MGIGGLISREEVWHLGGGGKNVKSRGAGVSMFVCCLIWFYVYVGRMFLAVDVFCCCCLRRSGV